MPGTQNHQGLGDPRRAPTRRLSATGRWGVTGLCLIAVFSILAWLSPRFDYGLSNVEKPIVGLVTLLVLAGVVYLAAVVQDVRQPQSGGATAWVLAIGLGLRLLFWTSTPMLEDDFYRYLWDGGVLANGENPYLLSPEAVLGTDGNIQAIPTPLRELAAESGGVIDRVNHPRLRTIYPPVAQGAFALSHLLSPWNIQAWRAVLLGFDILSLALLVLLLRHAAMPLWLLAIYWWNPVLIKEVYNSCHMDVLVLPFVLGALLCTVRKRYGLAATLLALGVGAKLWPILLLPLLLRPLWRQPLQLAGTLATFACVASALLLPIWLSRLDRGSGFVAYAQRWEMNDALYMLLYWMAQGILRLFDDPELTPHLVARGLAAVLLCSCIAMCIRRDFHGPRDLYRRALWILAFAFLLSPTQFPWYFIWVLPFLTLSPCTPLQLLTILLPLYYVRFHLQARGSEKLFDYGIVWIEHLPVWIALTWHWLTNRRRPATAGGS